MTEFEKKLKLAATLAAKGRVSRRDFVQLALAAGLTAMAANAMLVQTVRAEPKKGGTLKIGIGDGFATDSMDPGLTFNAVLGVLLHDFEGIVSSCRHKPEISPANARDEGFSPKVTGYSRYSPEQIGEPANME